MSKPSYIEDLIDLDFNSPSMDSIPQTPSMKPSSGNSDYDSPPSGSSSVYHTPPSGSAKALPAVYDLDAFDAFEAHVTRKLFDGSLAPSTISSSASATTLIDVGSADDASKKGNQRSLQGYKPSTPLQLSPSKLASSPKVPPLTPTTSPSNFDPKAAPFSPSQFAPPLMPGNVRAPPFSTSQVQASVPKVSSRPHLHSKPHCTFCLAEQVQEQRQQFGSSRTFQNFPRPMNTISPQTAIESVRRNFSIPIVSPADRNLARSSTQKGTRLSGESPVWQPAGLNANLSRSVLLAAKLLTSADHNVKMKSGGPKHMLRQVDQLARRI